MGQIGKMRKKIKNKENISVNKRKNRGKKLRVKF